MYVNLNFMYVFIYNIIIIIITTIIIIINCLI